MRVRERVDPKDAGGVERNPVSERPEEIRVWPSSVFGKGKGGETAQMASGDSVNELITRPPGPQADGKYPPPRCRSSPLLPPSFSAQVLSFPSFSVQVSHRGSPFDENCTPSREPDGAREGYGHLTYDEFHQ